MLVSSTLRCSFCGLHRNFEGGILEVIEQSYWDDRKNLFVWYHKRVIRPYSKIFVDDFATSKGPKDCCGVFASARLCHVLFLEDLRRNHYNTDLLVSTDSPHKYYKFYAASYYYFDCIRNVFMLYKLFKKRR
jgi:hypothetical protein